MGITLLTLSRQHAEGKINTADYRAQRRILVDQQVFQLEERTQPGLVKESEAAHFAGRVDATQPAGYYANLGYQSTHREAPAAHQPVPEAEPSYVAKDTTTGHRLQRLEGLSQTQPVATKPTGQANKGLIAGFVVGLFALAAVAFLWLGDSEAPLEPLEDPLQQATLQLLENPDWQLGDLKAYRQQISGQTHGLTEQQNLARLS